MQNSTELEHLPIAELQQRAENGDAQAIALVEAFEAGMISAVKTATEAMNAQAAANVARMQGVMLGSAASPLAVAKEIFGPRVTGWEPMTMARPSAPAASIPRSMAESLRTLDRRAKRMARAIDKIIGLPPRHRFVSHLPSRVSR